MDDDLQHSKPNNAEPLYPKLIQLLKKLAIVSAIFVPCSAIFTLFVVLWASGTLERWQTSLSLPHARNQFNSQLEVINEIVHDTLIDETIYAPFVPETSLYHCIAGSVSRVYGGNRPEEAIIEDYAEAFIRKGWRHTQSQSRKGYHTFILPAENDHSVDQYKVAIEFWPSNDDVSSFQITYSLVYSYRYPSFSMCTA